MFFTALNSPFGTKKILDFGGSRFMTLARYFIISVLIVAFAMACTFLAMPSDISIAMPAQEEVTRLLDNVLKIVPSNLLEPFREANTPQLLLIAIATGYLIGALDERVGVLKSFIQQANVLGLNLANLVCTLVPYFVGLLLCLKIWTDDTEMLRFLWAPIAVAIAISIVVCLISVLCVSVVTRVSPVLLARKLWGTFCNAVKSGVLDYSSVDSLAGTCKRLLGIDGEFARATLPQGLVLFMPTSAVGIWVFVMFAVQLQHIPFDLLWLVSAGGVIVILAVATPPVSGANLLAFVMAFMYLGVSLDLLLDAMIFDLVFCVFCIAADQAMLQLETIMQAKRLGFLDEDVLRAPLSE